MVLTKDQFFAEWKAQDESQSERILDVAWRRYQHVQDKKLQSTAVQIEQFSLADLEGFFRPLLEHPSIKPLVTTFKFLTLPANKIPWYATGIQAIDDVPISCFAVGRTWRSRVLDLFLPPQFNLWYKIGVNGDVFNSTRDTRTFKCIPGHEGELYVANHFPGQFSDRIGGRVAGKLSVYDKAEGEFNILIVQWQKGMTIPEDVKGALETIEAVRRQLAAKLHAQIDPMGLLKTGNERLTSDYFATHFPVGWTLLWFLGVSEIYYQEQDTPDHTSVQQDSRGHYLTVPMMDTTGLAEDLESAVLSPIRSPTTPAPSSTMIRCRPNHNVGILQKDITPAVPLTCETTTSWSWNISSLPSRLREDTPLTHDYLSLALEFENGRDITYTWSWELPEEYGYWCPLATWDDREYHVVIRSGTAQLGTWLDEKRNIWRDYVKYINDDDTNRPVPKQIVRVWLIAGNRWQRYPGEMLIKRIVLQRWDESDSRIEIL